MKRWKGRVRNELLDSQKLVVPILSLEIDSGCGGVDSALPVDPDQLIRVIHVSDYIMVTRN